MEREFEEEIGRIKHDMSPDVVVRVTKFKGKWYVDLRNYSHNEAYTGFMKSGIGIKLEDFDKIMVLLNDAKEKIMQTEVESY